MDRRSKFHDDPDNLESLTVDHKLEVIREILDRCAYSVRLP